MRSADPTTPDPDDFFSDTRMSFGDHIEDLRAHLLRAIYGFLIGMALSLVVSQWVTRIISAPVERALADYNQRAIERRLAQERAKWPTGVLLPVSIILPRDDLMRGIGMPAEETALNTLPAAFARALDRLGVDLPADLGTKVEQDGRRGAVIELQAQISNPEAFIKGLQPILIPSTLKTMNVMEAMFVYFKVSVITGLVLSSPWVFYQIWAFVAAGLYPHEKRLVNVYLPFSAGLFLVGVIACQLFVMPRAVEALLYFNEWLGFDPDLRLNEWLGFALMLPVVFGLSFQTPLVMSFMNKIGVVSVDDLRAKRSIARFVMLIVAAFLTPTVDPFTMLSMWVPMCLLYELGILICVYQKNDSPFDELEPAESDELVEV